MNRRMLMLRAAKCYCSANIRCYKTDTVRVRFAPSPTGFLHLGGLRTALYNFLFAKKHNGKFILRIEDTDQTRLVSGAVQQLQDDLNWAGIEIDEGPSQENHYGPYIQSSRLPIYNDHVNILLNNGSAYHCFCNDKRLQLLRREALRAHEIPKYDNRCRHLPPDVVKSKLEKGDVSCIRFKISENDEFFNDLIYGDISYNISLNEGDPVIIKSDGFPTYHFANVVDDHFMKITHVLRGVEWQISTTKHILLYRVQFQKKLVDDGSASMNHQRIKLESPCLLKTAMSRAFNWNPPLFGHLPLLMNADGTKLSKRQGDIKISYYRENNIFPLALINFIVHSGGGFSKDLERHLKPKCYTIDELSNQFDLTQINSHSGKLMTERLLEFNRLELKRMLQNVNEEKKLIIQVKKLVQDKFCSRVSDSSLQINEDYIRNILHWSANRIEKLADVVAKDFEFVWVIPPQQNLEEFDKNVVELFKTKLEKQEELKEKDSLTVFLKTFCKENEIKYSNFMKLLRSVLSGLKDGPGVAEMIAILGKENSLKRLENCLNNTRSLS